MDHPRGAADRDRDLDRADLPPSPTPGQTRTIDPDRVRDHHEPGRRPSCLTNCHGIVQQPLKIFIGWSGTRSKAIARELRAWLPLLFDNVEPFMSDVDIDAGSRSPPSPRWKSTSPANAPSTASPPPEPVERLAAVPPSCPPAASKPPA